ncbi:MAG: hypothetical protein L3J37_11920 [Rhodobacteraceae bacterium]|nr:hypothetical protein [Paracoccaceae bacterium]
MQKIHQHPKAKYSWNFPRLDLTYFEIPKTGSSSVKTVLFRTNYRLDPEDTLNIGGGKLALRFPESRLTGFAPEDCLGRILVIYRDPVARAKSAYRSIFLGRQQMDAPLSVYFEKYLPAYLESPESDGLLNHHKPMSWFFPQDLLNDPRVTFVETSDLNTLPEILDLEVVPLKKDDTSMPHLLNVNKSLGDIDMTNAEIRAAMGADFDDDFKLFEALS